MQIRGGGFFEDQQASKQNHNHQNYNENHREELQS
jgi:hypothetical protein